MSTWTEHNKAAMVREFAALRRLLGEPDGDLAPRHEVPEELEVQPDQTGESPLAIDQLSALFRLSSFERHLLLLCAGVEMESALAERCAELAGRGLNGGVTFTLAMAVLPHPHWSAFGPTAPLRRERLLEVDARHGLTSAPLRIDERILHFLAGVNRLDQRLEPLLQRREQATWLYEQHWRLATETLPSELSTDQAEWRVHLFGDDPEAQEAMAATLAERTGRTLHILRLEDTPTPGVELEQFSTLWSRETLLLPAMLMLQWEDGDATGAARRLAERLPGPLLVGTRDPQRPLRRFVQHEVNKAGPRGQREMWQAALAADAQHDAETLDQLAQQFRMSAETIMRLAGRANHAKDGGEHALAQTCRAVARPRLETLAQRIVPSATWQDLVLPEPQMRTLVQLAAQSRHRMTVYEKWGFAERGRRGLGMSVLFAGPSGTGKTLAAEVLAAELELDLYRIDLASVVSKYIGETERNLRQLFDAAESGGSLLLFDEADALFGKRAEVKDSHDRYANIEVGYLLQRMETFQGIAILTTNMKASLDKAFQRRLRFQVDFPLPDEVQRQAIWARVFPTAMPRAEVFPERLASLNMPGGSIRNIALNAAFLAAEQHAEVSMQHLLEATRMEALKAERPLVQQEIRGWV